MVVIPLEDNFTDILGKAQRGLRLGDAELSRRAGISAAQLATAKAGQIDETVVRKLAAALHLGADALVASAKQAWHPADPGPIDGLACFTTPFSDMTVNAYLVFDLKTKQAAAFDTGADCEPMLEFARRQGFKLKLILLTHAHGDHVFALDRLKEATGAQAYVSERETIPGAEPFANGRAFTLGRLNIEARRTSGHARRGTTYVVTGFASHPSSGLAFVGDALFAGSMGGGLVNYDEALRTNRESIFTLPDDTVICPGHGPLTTVGEEKQHNPFFPEFQQQHS
jgi:hydroxyacylglutathione hydrolase